MHAPHTSCIVEPLFPKEQVPASIPTPREVGTTLTPIVAFPCARTECRRESFGQVGGFCQRFQSRIEDAYNCSRRIDQTKAVGFLARVACRDHICSRFAAAIASSALAKTQVSLSTGMPPLSQSIANNAVSSANDCGSAIITAAGTMRPQK